MSFLADYYREREGCYVIEDDKGFCSYSFNEQECYIMDIFVVKDERKTGHATTLADKACAHAREYGCRYVTGSVDPRTDSATDSMKVLLAYGMKVHSIREPLIFFIKEL